MLALFDPTLLFGVFIGIFAVLTAIRGLAIYDETEKARRAREIAELKNSSSCEENRRILSRR